jgi:hypothetical protein
VYSKIRDGVRGILRSGDTVKLCPRREFPPKSKPVHIHSYIKKFYDAMLLDVNVRASLSLLFSFPTPRL